MSLTLNSSVRLSSGTEMPVVGLGTWRSEAGKVKDAVHAALVNGYLHIDAAALYRNQTEVGEGIAAAFAEGAITRERLFVTSKLWNTDHAPEDVRPACEKTLRELGLEYLDQYLMHWPVAWRKQEDGEMFPRAPSGEGFDNVDIDFVDTWRAMEELVDAGLVKSIGVSNFAIQELERLLAACRIRPVVNQVECHPYLNQDELRAFMNDQDIHLVAYCPLGNVSPGKEVNVTPLENEHIAAIATRLSKSPAQVVLRWGLQKGNIVIPKSVTPSRIVENSQLFDFELTDEDMQLLSNLPQGRPVNPQQRPGGKPVFPTQN